MTIRGILLASISLAYLGCLAQDPCKSTPHPDYTKPLAANLLQGCWDRIIQYPDHLRDTLSFFCFGDSTLSTFAPSEGVRQFSCRHFKMDGNRMSFDSLIMERFDSLNGAWQLISMNKSYRGSITEQSWAISRDSLVEFQYSYNPNSCGNSLLFEYKYARHTGRIDSSGFRHCDSLGYR
jgi:hypothetical protein